MVDAEVSDSLMEVERVESTELGCLRDIELDGRGEIEVGDRVSLPVETLIDGEVAVRVDALKTCDMT